MSPFGFGRECVLAFEFDLSKFHAYSVYDGHLLMVLCNVDDRYCG
jgi:hypothetical protein